MNELALCAGIGGACLGLKRAGFRTICYVEIAPYPVEVLKTRIRQGELDPAPIWDDVTTFDGTPWRGCVQVITAGFPCQPFSQAGLRRGEHDPRYLWPAIFRIICEVRPRYVLLENVLGLATLQRGRVLGRILADLASWLSDCGGGRIESIRLRAADIGAPHRRERIFLVAYPVCQCSWLENDKDRQQGRNATNVTEPAVFRPSDWQAHSEDLRNGGHSVVCTDPCGSVQQWRQQARAMYGGSVPQPVQERQTQSRVGRVFDGISPGMDTSRWPARPGDLQYSWEAPRLLMEKCLYHDAKLASLGNAMVPQLVTMIGTMIHVHYHRYYC